MEQPIGVILQIGGQTPLKLARGQEAAGVPICRTTPESIDRAEDRERFQQMIEKLGLKQSSNATARSFEEAFAKAETIVYPLVVRPSYVLSVRAMEIVYDASELENYMTHAVKVSNDSPVLLDHFLNAAIEIDIDAVSRSEERRVGKECRSRWSQWYEKKKR